MTAYNGGIPADQSDSIRLVWPNRGADFLRDELETAWAKAYEEWEFVWGLGQKDPELLQDPVWSRLQHRLAVYCDDAFAELENYRETRHD